MVSLVFHGGHYKTGTTSVQSALRASEAGLKAAGILYPANPDGSHFGKLQHADLLTKVSEGKFDQAARYLEQIAEEARAAGCERVLLSSELSTSLHLYPAQFEQWIKLARKSFEDIRYVFVVRDIVRYAISMYRELIKSGSASFHYDIVRPILVDRLVEQQRSIAFFRHWDASRVTLLDFQALSADRLVHNTVKSLIGFEVEEEVHLNSSAKRAQNMASLLLNDVYALVGAHLGLYPMSTSVRQLVGSAVKRGKLKRAFNEEFAERLEDAFIEVTEKHVKRAAEESREAIEQSKIGLPEDAVAYLFSEAKPAAAA
ncbi:MAG TPA: sulfotransferase [Dongiaceae bacterium]|nr:sulfotransferase [Dongiaceae bacterium]